MKKCLIVLSILLFPSSSLSSTTDYSMCYQVGFVYKQPALLFSNVLVGVTEDGELAKTFSEAIEKNMGNKFEASSFAACYGYSSKKKAEDDARKKLKLALKRNFKLFRIILGN